MKKMFLLAATLSAATSIMAMHNDAANAFTPAKARKIVADLQSNGVRDEDIRTLAALYEGASSEARPHVTVRVKRDSLVLGSKVVISEDPQKASAKAALIGFTLGAAQIIANTALTADQKDDAFDAELVQALRQHEAVSLNPASRAASDVPMSDSL